MTFAAYLPQDRLRALARHATLPDRTTGAALFADLSGFTPLTEALRATLGPRRGAEELTRQLNVVYTALIAEVEKYGGSVIGFAGDAITCWLADAQDAAAPRAVACAFALQTAMQAFQALPLPNATTLALALKVSVATGPARRFVVGDPAIHRLDTLAGVTLERMAAGEQLAERGDVMVDEATVMALGPTLTVREWRTSETGLRLAVVTAWAGTVAPTPLAPVPPLAPATFTQWLHPRVFAREQLDQGSFLTEFRPCAVVFVRFVGIDYDAADAATRLDAFLGTAQRLATQYDGTVLQLLIGDKGSYLYLNFGALSAHEDDARRAVKTAWTLRQQTTLPVQMGVTYGVMRVGTYGGPTRRTYGALGDDVNLAARLMQAAAPGEILVSGRVQVKVAGEFTFSPARHLHLKGKAGTLPAFAVLAAQPPVGWRLPEPQYYLPLVGRQAELQIIAEKLALTRQQQPQIIGIVGEAGVGKSRLVAEALGLARRQGFSVYGGACQSDGLNTPYLAWKAIWSAFFQLDPTATATTQIQTLTNTLQRLAPQRFSALPLLGQMLNLPLPDNDFTRTLEPKFRQRALHALLEACLRAALQTHPLLIVIEDLHWIDALSHDLLEELARAFPASPLGLVMVYRPPQLARIAAPRLEARPNSTRLTLHELNAAEAAQIIRAKLAAFSTTLPPEVEARLLAQAQGNPFYLEELLNYLHDQGLDQLTTAAPVELPDSLHSLILSRIDRLLEREKITLKVASIIGRLFRVDWLGGYYPALGAQTQITHDLAELARLDITPLDTPEPELTYLFKHIITHEVTYESLPFATRAKLHEQLAQYLEGGAAAVETIAFHYGRSDNTAKQIEYLRKAGEAAQQNFANDAALVYYGQLLPLLPAAPAKAHILLQRGQVLERIGQWADAETDYRTVLEATPTDVGLKAKAQLALGNLHRSRGDYASARTWLAQAQATHTRLQDTSGLVQTLIETGNVLRLQGDYAPAQAILNEGLALTQAVDDRLGAARALKILGLVAWNQADYAAAQALHEKSLSLHRALDDKPGIASAFNSLGLVAMHQGDYATAQAMYEKSLSLQREMGDKHGISNSLNNLGFVANEQGAYAAARALHEESLSLRRELGDKLGIAVSLNNLGTVIAAQDDYPAAQAFHEESLALRREIGDRNGVAISLSNLGNVALAQGHYAAARALYEEGLALCQALDDKSNGAYALFGLGLVDLAEARPAARQRILRSLHLRVEIGEKFYLTHSLLGMAGLALREGHPYFAAQLLGTVAAAFKALKAVMEPEFKPFYAQTLGAAKEAVGAAAFQAAWAEGAQWTLEETVQKVLAGETP